VAFTGQPTLEPQPRSVCKPTIKPLRSKIRTTYSNETSSQKLKSSLSGNHHLAQPTMGVEMCYKKSSITKKNAATQWEKSFIEISDLMIKDEKFLAPFLDTINIDNLPLPVVTSTFMFPDTFNIRETILTNDLSSPVSTRKSRYATVMSSIRSES